MSGNRLERLRRRAEAAGVEDGAIMTALADDIVALFAEIDVCRHVADQLRSTLTDVCAARDEACRLVEILRDTHEPDSDYYEEDTDAARGLRERAARRAEELAKVGQP